MIKKIWIVLCLPLLLFCLSGCEDKEPPVISNERDWTVVIEDENADPSYLEIGYEKSNILESATVTFKYKYKINESYLPKVSLRYKDNKTYYVVKPTVIMKINRPDEKLNDINDYGEYRITFGIFENEDRLYPFKILARFMIIIE